MAQSFRLEEFGFEVEIGKVAKQANGAVWFKHGGTVLLASATETAVKEFPGFLPLTIDYREQYSAAGKIPGGYYKREGRSSDREVLTSRLIDRALRPFFPTYYFNQVQILVHVYSVDKEHAPNVISLVAASLALAVSDIPALEPIGAVEMVRVDGSWQVNPLYPDAVRADARIVVAGTKDGICMVEGAVNEVDEQECVDILFRAHESIKKIVAWQEEIRAQMGKAKSAVDDSYGWSGWEDRAEQFLTEDRVDRAYIEDKVARNEYLDQIRAEFVRQCANEIAEKEIPEAIVHYVLDSVLKEKLTEQVIARKKRIDGRPFDQIRKISVDVGLLPFTHGSALFTRGQTQALVSVTLGSAQDEQRIESIMNADGAEEDGSFLLHYNFLPFSTGEVRPLRGPGRREVGHGYLAASAFTYLRPDKASFPYTIRIVADMLESDGSTSMATAAGSTMALMHAGVPIKKMVAGVAMGLLMNKSEEIAVLSDISGVEDAFGLMDFKVVGTDEGITAIQMDIKHKGGLDRSIFVQALDQAKQGRLFILGQMRKVMDKPNEQLSPLVPRVFSFQIDPDKIGAVIGSGGKTIREITEKTQTSIDIEPDGLVKIFGASGELLDEAVKWVKTLAGQVARGDKFEGKVRKIADFGMFVELVPGQDGLVHISNIPRDQQKTFARLYKLNDVVPVEIVDYDEVTGRIGLRIVRRNTDSRPGDHQSNKENGHDAKKNNSRR